MARRTPSRWVGRKAMRDEVLIVVVVDDSDGGGGGGISVCVEIVDLDVVPLRRVGIEADMVVIREGIGRAYDLLNR